MRFWHGTRAALAPRLSGCQPLHAAPVAARPAAAHRRGLTAAHAVQKRRAVPQIAVHPRPRLVSFSSPASPRTCNPAALARSSAAFIVLSDTARAHPRIAWAPFSHGGSHSACASFCALGWPGRRPDAPWQSLVSVVHPQLAPHALLHLAPLAPARLRPRCLTPVQPSLPRLTPQLPHCPYRL